MTEPGGRPTHLRALNERRVLEVVLREGAISRAQLARETGLSKPTISLALARMEQGGLLREVGRTSGGRGATALLYDLDPRSGHVLAVDVGRQRLRVVLADIAGRTLARRNERTRARGAAALPAQLGTIARDLAREARIRLRDLTAATIGAPGVMQADGDRLLLAPQMPWLQQPGIVDRLRDELGGAPLAIENDVNLAALAELANGHGTDSDDFVFVSVGTGVGMALVLGGRLRRGATGSAGEIGYLPLPGDPTGAAAARRPRATYEEQVNASGFVRAAKARGLRVTRAEQVVAAARAGDRTARAIVRREGELLGLGVAAVTAVLDPGLVVLGGGLGLGAGDLLVDTVAEVLARRAPARPRVVTSAIGDDVVLRGALAASLLDAHDRVFGDATGHAGTTSPTERARHAGTRISGPHLAALALTTSTLPAPTLPAPMEAQ
jgi:predicted NBD/HSP70 family sugar kinase